jgi:EpsI family protein
MITRLLILTTLFISASTYLVVASQREPEVPRQVLAEVPLRIDDWRAREASPLDNRVVQMLGVDDFVNRIYLGPEAAAGLYIGFYKSQREGSAIHSPMNCLPGAGWKPMTRTTISVPVRESENAQQTRAVEINRITIAKGLDKQVVLYWYQSHGRVVASEYWGKIYTVWDTIKINRTDAALVRIIVPVVGADEKAERAAAEAGVAFVQSLFPLLSRYLPA